MTLITTSEMYLCAGFDYTLRIMRSPGSFAGAYTSRTQPHIIDTDRDLFQLTVMYDGTDEQFSAEDVKKASYVWLEEANGKQHFYYVTDRSFSGTAPDRYCTFTLLRDVFIGKSQVQGRWEALPETGNIPFSIMSDVMVPSRAVNLPKIGNDTYIVKISTTERVTFNEDLHRIDRQTDTPTTYYALVHGEQSASPVKIGSPVYAQYPTLDTLVGNIDKIAYDDQLKQWFGLTVSAIQDISISERSPYEILTTGIGGLSMQTIGFGKAGAPDTQWAMVPRFDSHASADTEISFTLSDMEFHLGRMSVHTSNDDMLADIPMGTFVMPGRRYVYVRAVSDLTGLYTEIRIGNLEGKRSFIMMPEGKIPCIGSDWGEYTLAQRTYDRENMTLAIQNAKAEAMQGAVMGATNGLLTGALLGGPAGAGAGAASFALGTFGSSLSRQRAEQTALKQQDLKEKLVQNSVGTAYNTGYGMEYIRKAGEDRARLQIDMPAQAENFGLFSEYIKWHGYPWNNREKTLNMSAIRGFVKGTVIDMSISAHERDMMNAELSIGVRFV